MKNLIAFTFILLLFACGSETKTDTKSQSEKLMIEKSIKATKQFVTNDDGSVSENSVAVDIQIFANKIDFVFSNDNQKSFSIEYTSKIETEAGVTYKTTDKKYTEIFISGGEAPQVNLNAISGATTFM